MNTITNLSQGVTQYYKNITSLIGGIMRIQGDIQVLIEQRSLTSLQKENSRDAQGAWKDRALDGQLMIHATAALL